MKRFLTTFLVIIAIVISLSVSSTAQVNSTGQSVSNIQVTLKSKNWGPDPTWGGSRATITLTTNKMGNLAYVEEYYSIDSYGQPNFFSGNRHEEEMKDYTVSFDIVRPKNNHKQDWSLIKSKVIIDRVVAYEVWINTSGTYKSFTGKAVWFNNSTIDIGKGRPNIQKKEPFNPISNAKIDETENITVDSTIATKKSPMPETYAVIGMLFSVYILTRKKKDNK